MLHMTASYNSNSQMFMLICGHRQIQLFYTFCLCLLLNACMQAASAAAAASAAD
jgi:hypothetical protein